MRIALCDDDRVQLDILEDAAKGCRLWRGKALEVDVFLSGAKLLNAVRSGRGYEYIFLDIEMPGLSGFDVYSKLGGLSEAPVIFVSTHIERLPEAFALRSHGFLAKPYDQDTFDRTVKSVIDQKVEKQFFQFARDGVQELMPCRDILLFTIQDYTLTMHSIKGGEIVLPRKRLDEVERELAGFGFFRCNRSTLVNLRYCSGRKGNILVGRHIGDTIEISRRKLKEYEKQLIIYKMGDKNAF